MAVEALVVGLGLSPADDVTLEGLRLLDGCDRVFCDAVSLPSLRRLIPKARLARDARAAAAAARRGERVALAVWGHPKYGGPLADALRRLVPCRLVPSNSPIGSALSAAGAFLGGERGYEGAAAVALRWALDNGFSPSPRLACVVYGPGEPAALWRRLASSLGAREVLAFHPAPESLPASSLGARRAPLAVLIPPSSPRFGRSQW